MKPTEQPTELNSHNVHATQQATRTARVRLWAIIRIIDNRIQALAPSNPEDRESEPDWTDLGGETCLWEDRETAFQIGRANGGLLVSADGIPGPHRMTAFHDRLRSLRTALAPEPAPVAEGASQPATKPARELPKARGNPSRSYVPPEKPAAAVADGTPDPY